MNCKDIKAAIDSASRRNPVSSDTLAHLSGCPDCRHYSDQSNALLSLLAVQPRVRVPADFNFRLSARIARAEAQIRPTGPFSFLDNLFGKTFSIKQAAASLAALAVMAAGTTLYFQNSQQVTNNALVAHNTQAVQPASESVLPARLTSPAPTANLVARSQSRATTMKSPVLIQASTSVMADQSIANDKVSVYNSEKGHVSKLPKGGVYFGAESSDQMARPASFGSF